MFLTSVPFAVLTLVGAGFILPDSPRWLASKNMDSFPALKKIARAERERDGIDERIRRDQHVCEREEERRDGKNEIAVCDFR